MKKLNLKVAVIVGLLMTGTFVNCTKTKEKTTNTVAETIEIPTTNLEEKTAVASRSPIVFITGYDKGDNKFYSSARTFFKEKQYQIVEDAYSLEEVINWMNKNVTENPYGEVHIVSHSNPWKGMSLETVINGERITAETLQRDSENQLIPELKDGITKNTKIVFHSCGLGKNSKLMQKLKKAFSAKEAPQVVASPYYNVFGGEFSNHYLAKPYYVFYPTANSPGKTDLSKEIARKYPNEREIEWFAALTNERERYIGEPYTFQFNVPVTWEFDYHNSDNEIPTFETEEALMDWIANDEDLAKELNNLDIPVEKFRWRWNVKNSKLTLKGKSTVLCVLKPLTKPYGDLQHIKPDTNNKRLYAMK